MKCIGRIFTKIRALMHFGTEINTSDFRGQEVKVQGHGGIKYAGNGTLRVEMYSAVQYWFQLQYF